jgi:mono/diheme cytochrome c family protein
MIPTFVKFIVLALLVAALVPLALIVRARAMRSDQPRVHIFQDMDIQPKFKDQAYSKLFNDHRSMRPQIAGTVARGMLRDDEHYYQGKVKVTIDGELESGWATSLPKQVKLTEKLVRRGQRQFNIYCAPCHGLGGEGDGPVALRATKIEATQWGWVAPLSVHSEAVLARPDGHIFNIITKGIRTMPAYGPQVAVEDRWAIVAYVRALQYSRSRTIADVPVEIRQKLK